MGRTLATMAQLILEEQTSFDNFRRALRREDQRTFDALFAAARKPVSYTHLPHPDLTDVLEHGGGSYDAGGADPTRAADHPAMRLDLARYEGRPADFLEIDGSVCPDKAEELMAIIRAHLPSNAGLDESRLGRYQFGHEERRSYPLALTQLLIAYQLILTADQIERATDRAVATI